VALAAVIAAYTVQSTPEGAVALMVTAIGGVALFAAGVAFGRLTLALWAVAGLAATYVASLLYRGAAPDAWSALVAIGLVLSSEMASWSIDSRRRGTDDGAVHALRLITIASALAAALLLVVVVQAAGDFGGGGITSVALATVAVVLGVGAVCLLMWRGRTAGPS
jgi:hypothetical protein